MDTDKAEIRYPTKMHFAVHHTFQLHEDDFWTNTYDFIRTIPVVPFDQMMKLQRKDLHVNYAIYSLKLFPV